MMKIKFIVNAVVAFIITSCLILTLVNVVSHSYEMEIAEITQERNGFFRMCDDTLYAGIDPAYLGEISTDVNIRIEKIKRSSEYPWRVFIYTYLAAEIESLEFITY